MKMKKLHIVIPVFNRWHFTRACLESLAQQTHKQFKVVVVDHGSTDDTSREIGLQFPDVVVLTGDETMWWTAAINMGIDYSIRQNADLILTLNNDTLAEPDYIANLFKAVENAPPNALIGSAAVDANTREVTYCGEKLLWYAEKSSPNIKNLAAEPVNSLIAVTHFPGRGLLIPGVVFEKIGLFDDRYFPHYMADYEFTLRAAKNGFPAYCALNARIVTYPEASGANEIKATRSVSGYKQYLFGIKGSGNLPLFYRYALRHCPVYALPSHLILGTARRLIGYWI